MNFKNERLKSPFQPAQKPSSEVPSKPHPVSNHSTDDSLTSNINNCIDDLKKMAIQNKEKRQNNYISNTKQSTSHIKQPFRKQSESRTQDKESLGTSQERLSNTKNLNSSLLQSYMTNSNKKVSTQQQKGSNQQPCQQQSVQQPRAESAKRKSNQMLSKYVTQQPNKYSSQVKSKEPPRNTSACSSSRISSVQQSASKLNRGNSSSNIHTKRMTSNSTNFIQKSNYLSQQSQNDSVINISSFNQKRQSKDVLQETLTSNSNIIKGCQSSKNIQSEKKKSYQPVLRSNKWVSSNNYNSQISATQQTPTSKNDAQKRCNSVQKISTQNYMTNPSQKTNKENAGSIISQRKSQPQNKYIQSSSNHNDSFQVSFFQMGSTQEQLKIMKSSSIKQDSFLTSPSKENIKQSHSKAQLKEFNSQVDLQEPRIIDQKLIKLKTDDQVQMVSCNIQSSTSSFVQSQSLQKSNEQQKEQINLKKRFINSSASSISSQSMIPKQNIRYINLGQENQQTQSTLSQGPNMPVKAMPNRLNKQDQIEEIHYQFVQFHQRNKRLLNDIEQYEAQYENNYSSNNNISTTSYKGQVEILQQEQVLD